VIVTQQQQRRFSTGLTLSRPGTNSLPISTLTRSLSPTVVPSSSTSGGGGGGLGGALIGIGLDWLRSKVIPGNSGGSTPLAQPVPQGCPQGQRGVPPNCFDIQPGGATQGGGVVVFQGEAVMGRYGAALQPAYRNLTVARCPRGAVLGNDGLCYNKRDLNKSERMWIPARKPLLTGGDLNAIARASRAANKMKTQAKRLQKLGLMPKPNRGGRRQAPAAARLPATTSVVNVE